MGAERFARQIALPEIGPDGQARLAAARVGVIGGDIAAATAAVYLRAAGVGEVVELAAPEGLDRLQMVVRSGFDDDALLPAARRLGLPVIVMRASADVVDVLSFPPREPEAAPPADGPGIHFRAAAAPVDGAAGVLAGTLAAAEALHVLVAEPGARAATTKHLRLPLDGREPLRQEIPTR